MSLIARRTSMNICLMKENSSPDQFFQPIRMGNIPLKGRIIMAPLPQSHTLGTGLIVIEYGLFSTFIKWI